MPRAVTNKLAAPAQPPRMTQAERTAISDQRMYEAAVELICEIGTHNTTLKDIGERAGYSRGLASNRFGSKEALFGNLVHQFNVEWAAELAKHVGGRTGMSALLAALEAVETFLLEQSAYMKAMYILWYESISNHNSVRAKLAAHHAAYRRDAQRYIEEGIAEGFIRPHIVPERFAVQFCSFIFGIIYQWLVTPQGFDVRHAFNDYRLAIIELITERRRAPSR